MSEASPSRAERQRSAIGLLEKMARGTFRITGSENSLILRGDMDREAFDATLPQYPSGQAFLKRPKNQQNGLFRDYVRPMLELAAEIGEEKPFLVWTGDNRQSLAEPTLVRARTVGHPGLGVTQRFRSERHTPKTLDLTEVDKPFAAKADKLAWRGVTTGRFHTRPGHLSFSARYYVGAAMAREKVPGIDIGYSGIVQEELMNDQTLQMVQASIKPRLSWDEMLDARYVLSLEGNDVATGLPWALHSNACVVMPAPTCQSWYCEHLLKPFVHYVPVAPDLSNIRQMFNWCRRNVEICERIAAAGRAFIAPFFREETEHKQALQLAKVYFKKVTIAPAADATLPEGLF